MSSNKGKLLDAFDVFWDHVGKAERNVRQYGHLGRLPPIYYGDPWEEDFADAYEGIRPYLRKFRRDRSFRVPAGLAFRSGPLRAETAHQALMFFLNKPEELHGEVGVLDSHEYLAIKTEAMTELEQRDRSRRAPSIAKDLPCSPSAKVLGEIATLKGALWEYHFRSEGEVVLAPLSLAEIRIKFFPRWSQSTATRRMQKLFKRKDATAAYSAMFARDATPQGYCRRFENGTVDVEAISRKSTATRHESPDLGDEHLLDCHK